MTIININTKRGQAMNEKARTNYGTKLEDIYKKYSNEKRRAMAYCKEVCLAENGKNFRIISHNLMKFSVAWETTDGLRIETAEHSYLVK